MLNGGAYLYQLPRKDMSHPGVYLGWTRVESALAEKKIDFVHSIHRSCLVCGTAVPLVRLRLLRASFHKIFESLLVLGLSYRAQRMRYKSAHGVAVPTNDVLHTLYVRRDCDHQGRYKTYCEVGNCIGNLRS